MPESTDPARTPSLTERFDLYRQLVEGLVLRGIEHPSCELKRAVSIHKSDLAGRLEFVKQVQGLANSHTKVECFIVIGADQREKRFYDVGNAGDFDNAELSKILSKYMQPTPRFVSHNNMVATTGERYVLIILEAVQPRPIMMRTEGSSDKIHFRPGDIWIKHNTDLRPATKDDLDLMYEPRIEEEASKRARLLFEHFKQDLGAPLLSQAVDSTPTPELLMGSRGRLGRFAAATIARKKRTRFTMLLEMARETLIQKWESRMEQNPPFLDNESDEEKALLDFYSDEYRPVLESVVDLGVSLIKYDGDSDWLVSVSSLLVEAFITSSNFGHLWPRDRKRVDVLPFHRPAFDIYIGLRVLATYAVARQRHRFLKPIFPTLVRPLSLERHAENLQPIVFWPFDRGQGLPEPINGRNPMLWENGVQASWGDLFRSEERFLSAAAQLELLLEFDSYIPLQYNIQMVKDFANANREKDFRFVPDFWNQPLNPAIPMAEHLFELILNNPASLADITVVPQLARNLFAGMSHDQRLLFFGEFLEKLHKWQDNAMMQQRRHSFYFSWPPRLQSAVEAYLQSQKP